MVEELRGGFEVSIILASRAVDVNSNNANFNVRNVDNGNVDANNLFNSNGNSNTNNYGVRPVASIHCGYATNGCIRDNIETNYVLSYFCTINKK